MPARPTSYERIAVDIGSKQKKALLHYAVNTKQSVSDVIRKLVSDFIESEVKR